MCKTKASTDVSTPAVAAAVVLAAAAISSAAAVITSVLLVILVTLLALSAAGIAGLVVMLRRERVGLWHPAPARPAAAGRVRARPALAERPAVALPVPSLRAIEGPSVIGGTVLTGTALTGTVLTGPVLTGPVLTGEVLAGGPRDTSPAKEMASARA
jgi:hypothetical protein